MTFSTEAYQRLLNALAPLELSPETLGYYVMGVHVGSTGKPLPESALGAEITVADTLTRAFPSRFGWANCLRKITEENSEVRIAGEVLVEANTGVMLTGLDGNGIARPRSATRETNDLSLVSFEEAQGFIRKNEVLRDVGKSVPFMYLDTTGNVTIGVGHKFESVNEAVALTGSWRTPDGIKASAEDVAKAYEVVEGKPAPRAYSYYRQFTNLTLDENKIEELFRADFDEHRPFAEQFYASLGRLRELPKEAQIVVVDMAYQLGLGKEERDPVTDKVTNRTGLTKFVNFKAALGRRDWRKAIEEVEVKVPPTPERDENRRAELRKLFQREPFFTRARAEQKARPLLQVLMYGLR